MLPLWLEPSDAADALKFQTLIDKTTERFNGIGFAAHATLLGGVMVDYNNSSQVSEVLGKTLQLAAETSPFVLTCKDIAGFDPWNQCLIVVLDRCDGLDRANITGHKLLKSIDTLTPVFAPPVGEPH